MRNIYLRKKECSKKIKNEENKRNNKIDISKHSLNGNNENKYSRNYNNNKKDEIYYGTNELCEILGKINQELYKNSKYNHTTITELLDRDFLNNISKINDNSSNNISSNSNISQNSYLTNNTRSLYDEKRTNNFDKNVNNINNNLHSNQFEERINSPLNDNFNIKKFGTYMKKNKISNFILHNPNKKGNQNNYIDIKNEDKEDNKVIRIRSIHKSIKKNNNNSQKKYIKKITPFYKDLNNKNNINKKATFSNPKNIINMANFYNFWSDNDGHLGGKINLALNNIYGNKIDFYSSLYYIIKIQSVWRGYYLRKSLLNQSSNSNIFYKQNLLIKTLFYILSKKAKKDNFQIFKQKLNKINNNNHNNTTNNNRKGYDLTSPLLNNISDIYQKCNKAKNGKDSLLNNKKKIYESKNNMKINNKKPNLENNNMQIIKRCNTITNYNIDNIKVNNNNKDNNNYSNYKVLRTHAICYKSHKKDKYKKEEDAKEKKINKKEILIKNKKEKNIHKLADVKITNKFPINNINTLNKNNNYISRNKKKNINNIVINNNNKNKNKIYKYKEYIYFLFLLFASIQKANNRGFFNEFISKLKEKKNDNLKKMKKNILLKIIKNKERKKLLYYFKIFKEKILTEKIKNIILKKNNTSFNIDNNNSFNIDINNNNLNNSIINPNINSKNSFKNYIEDKDNQLNRNSSKKHIKIRKINRSVSVKQLLTKNKSYYPNKYSNINLLKSTSISPRKMIIKQQSNINLKKLGEYYEFTPEYLLKKKMKDIFKNMDKKEKNIYFKRWKIKSNVIKNKKFLIYFIMLMKEYFCNDKSLKSNKEYALGKCMFIWYRKSFY